MTNAEKYLKDGVNLDEMAYDYNHTKGTLTSVFGWLRQQVKPTLTEDERVILRNINPNEYRYIARKGGGLFLGFKADIDGLKVVDTSYMFGTIFKPSLFQFIKERRRILY